MPEEIVLPQTVSPSADGAESMILWRSRERQCSNVVFFFVCIALTSAMFALKLYRFMPVIGYVFTIAPLAMAAWGWLETHCHWYTLTNQRLIEQKGIFIKKLESLELYRVTDLSAGSTLIQTLFGCGRVVITSTDASHPRLVINAVPKHMELFNALREVSEKCRMERRVRFFEL